MLCTLIILGGAPLGIASLGGNRVSTAFNTVSNTLPSGEWTDSSEAAGAEANPATNDAATALGRGSPSGSEPLASDNRKIIRNADIELSTKDVSKTALDI